MIKTLQIKNFRGFKEVTLRDLRRVNLLVGGNDTGKTSVLEALMLLLGDGSSVSELPITFRNNQAGGQSGNNQDDRENFWPWLFYDRNPANQIAITAEADGGQKLALSTQLLVNGAFLVRDVGGEGGGRLVLLLPNELRVEGLASPKAFRVSRLSVRPSHPVQDAEKYNQIALESDGE